MKQMLAHFMKQLIVNINFSAISVYIFVKTTASEKFIIFSEAVILTSFSKHSTTIQIKM